MSKKQDMEDLDRFMDFIRDNPDVKDMILNALNNAKNEETNNPYIFNPMTDGDTERPTIKQRLAMTQLMLKTGNDPKDGVHGNLPDHLINQKKWSK
jgi:hypothetical protein